MTRGRIAGIVAGSAAALAAIVVLAGALVVRSDWFREQVRERLVAAVATATQAASADSRLAIIAGAADHVKQRQPYPGLQLGVAVDTYIGLLPALRPGAAMIAQQPLASGLPGSMRTS